VNHSWQSSGLSDTEAAALARRGLVNRAPRTLFREYAQIVARNLLTWFNAMVLPAAVALFWLGEVQGGIAVSGMAIINTVLGLAQEVRAKYHLDQLALLVESKAQVLRGGKLRQLPAGDVVLGDCIALAAGETIVADGPVLEARFLEIDEALLTGESDTVRREPGQQLLSGSFCVAGEGLYRADKIGADAFANRTSAEARRYRFVASPLTVVINRIVQVLTYTAVGLIALYTVAYVLAGFPKTLGDQREFVRMIAATITSMVPQGLVLTATVSFTLGAIAMSRRGAVVQRLSAVETMAAIDVICTDKTGTLTTNRLRLERIEPLDPAADEEQLRQALRQFASASVDQSNKTIQALARALGQAQVELLEQIPFKSQNRYSAVRLQSAEGRIVLVLGAIEALRDRFSRDAADLDAVVAERQRAGLRLLALAKADGSVSLAGLTELPELPLQPLCLACLADELRPEAGQVLEALSAQGIDFKVLSGDNPRTVQGTVRHLELPWAQDEVVSGDDLAAAPDAQQLILQRSVFGRVSPEQKVEIVETLTRHGKHVAMIGDGVNDVLPIKRAALGIAMGEGSQASKRVSGLVLESNRFELLPETLEEGRTILRNLRRSAKLFLVKNVYSLILILAYYSGWLGLPFPYVPQQVTLLNWSVIGIPAFVIALSRERSTAATKPRFLREVGSFAIRTGIVFGLAGLAILLIAGWMHADDERMQRSMLLSVLILLGITALFRALTDGEPENLRGDRRFRLLGVLAIPVYLTAMYWPPAARFFELAGLTARDWGIVVVVVIAAYAACLLTDRFIAASRSPLAA
jgi:cation-transporting ATPase E